MKAMQTSPCDESAPIVVQTRKPRPYLVDGHAAILASMSLPSAPPASVHTLFPDLYQQLRRLARSRLSGGQRPTLLDTSALVHEAFMRMQRDGGVRVNDSEHFMAYAATTMRSIVIDFVHRRPAERRGGDAEHVTLDTRAAEQLGAASDDEVLAVHEALESLAEVDARLVRVVEMRYFAGLTDAEVAAALGVTDRTVRRDWERARLLLAQMLGR
jgi:RNA polymerase sigma factor (TIGR02999 family)